VSPWRHACIVRHPVCVPTCQQHGCGKDVRRGDNETCRLDNALPHFSLNSWLGSDSRGPGYTPLLPACLMRTRRFIRMCWHVSIRLMLCGAGEACAAAPPAMKALESCRADTPLRV
jgi:hypothetical protein